MDADMMTTNKEIREQYTEAMGPGMIADFIKIYSDFIHPQNPEHDSAVATISHWAEDQDFTIDNGKVLIALAEDNDDAFAVVAELIDKATTSILVEEQLRQWASSSKS